MMKLLILFGLDVVPIFTIFLLFALICSYVWFVVTFLINVICWVMVFYLLKWWWWVRSATPAPPPEHVPPAEQEDDDFIDADNLPVLEYLQQLEAALGPEFGDNLAAIIVAANAARALPVQPVPVDDQAAREAKQRELGHVRRPEQEARFERLEELADKVRFYEETDPIPLHLCCPISMGPLTDAILTHSGQCYQREALKKWIDVRGTCPKTNEHIADRAWYPNLEKTGDFEDWANDLLKKKRKSRENSDHGSSGRQKAPRIDKD